MAQTQYKDVFSPPGDTKFNFSASERLQVHNKVHVPAKPVDFACVLLLFISHLKQHRLNGVQSHTLGMDARRNATSC